MHKRSAPNWQYVIYGLYCINFSPDTRRIARFVERSTQIDWTLVELSHYPVRQVG